MQLNDLCSAPGARRSKLRVGRGIGSGLGKTAGRGHKVCLRVLAVKLPQDLRVANNHCTSVCLNLVSLH